jgi:hypothetical protein
MRQGRGSMDRAGKGKREARSCSRHTTEKSVRTKQEDVLLRETQGETQKRTSLCSAPVHIPVGATRPIVHTSIEGDRGKDALSNEASSVVNRSDGANSTRRSQWQSGGAATTSPVRHQPGAEPFSAVAVARGKEVRETHSLARDAGKGVAEFAPLSKGDRERQSSVSVQRSEHLMLSSRGSRALCTNVRTCSSNDDAL